MLIPSKSEFMFLFFILGVIMKIGGVPAYCWVRNYSIFTGLKQKNIYSAHIYEIYWKWLDYKLKNFFQDGLLTWLTNWFWLLAWSSVGLLVWDLKLPFMEILWLPHITAPEFQKHAFRTNLGGRCKVSYDVTSEILVTLPYFLGQVSH